LILNSLVNFSLIVFSVLNVIGIFISYDIFAKSKDSKQLLILIGWIFWLISSLFPLLLNVETIFELNQVIVYISTNFLAIGTFLIFASFTLYFFDYNKQFIIVSILIILLVGSFIFVAIEGEISITFLSFIRSLGIIGILGIFIIYRQRIKFVLSQSYRSIVFLALIIISNIFIGFFLQINGAEFPFYFETNDILIILGAMGSINVIVTLIILFIYIEHGFSLLQNKELKDNYSHDIGNILQIILAAGNLIDPENKMDSKNKEKIDMIIKKVEEAGELIKNIRKL
jgi:hypothetical protein